MPQPSPFNLSRRFSQIIGRDVTFTQAKAGPESKAMQVYGIYSILPEEIQIVVQADLLLLGSFAGSLLGLPDGEIRRHVGTVLIEEFLREAMNEVLNIASSAIWNEGRIVFTKMVTNPVYIEGQAGQVFRKPVHRSYFDVMVDGYQGGRFSIFTPFCE